jgi:hypothetical protein
MLNDYVDGLLEESLKTAVDEHLRSCPSCREELEQVNTVRRTLDQLPSRAAPPGFLESVHRRLEKEKVPRSSVRKPWGQRRVVLPAGVAAFATAAIALIVVLNVVEPRKEAGEMVVRDRSDAKVERELAVRDGSETKVERELAVRSHTGKEREAAAVEPPEPAAEDDIYSETAFKDEAVVKGEQKGRAGQEKRIAEEMAAVEETISFAAAKKAEPAEAPVISILLFKDTLEPPAEEASEYGTYDVEEREASGSEVSISGVKSRDFEGDALEEDAMDEMAKNLSAQAPAPSGAPEQVYAIVEQMVHDNGGRIVAKDYGEKGTTPQSMVVEMPVQAVDMFVDELMKYDETGGSRGVIIPEELKNGNFRRQLPDGVQTFAIKISFE